MPFIKIIINLFISINLKFTFINDFNLLSIINKY